MRVIGYRAFNDHGVDGWSLGSVGVAAPLWEAGLNHAVCLAQRGGLGAASSSITHVSVGRSWAPTPPLGLSTPEQDHRCAAPQCTCGFWALHTLGAVVSRFPFPSHIQAVVVGSGQVSIHRGGWRAERAQIVALIRPSPGPSSRLTELANRYGVPVIDAVMGSPEVQASRHLLSEYLAGLNAEAPEFPLDEARVARWVSEFGIPAFDPAAQWPDAVDTTMQRLAWDAAEVRARNPMGMPGPGPSPYAPVRPTPKRRFWQWR